MEKLYKVRALYTFEMDYIVKAEDEKEAKWMILNKEDLDDIVNYEYDQRGLGTIVQKVKQVSEEKAIDLLSSGLGLQKQKIKKELDDWVVRYKTDDEYISDLNTEDPDDYDEVEGDGKM